MSNEREIVIPVSLSEKTFKRFARFDMLRLRKKWLRPTVFALLMIAFGVVALLTRKPQSGLIAAVLFVVGLGLPLVYFGLFFSQVNVQAERLKLGKGRRAYTVQLTREGIAVQNDMKKEEPVFVPWKEARQAYCAKACIYLYVSPARAFLLPEGQTGVPQADVWEYIARHLGAEKCKML